MSGSSDVHIQIDPTVVTFIETSPDLLMIYMSGWAKYELKHNGNVVELEARRSGIDAVIDFYTRNEKVINPDKNVKKLIKLKKKGKLDDLLKAGV